MKFHYAAKIVNSPAPLLPTYFYMDKDNGHLRLKTDLRTELIWKADMYLVLCRDCYLTYRIVQYFYVGDLETSSTELMLLIAFGMTNFIATYAQTFMYVKRFEIADFMNHFISLQAQVEEIYGNELEPEWKKVEHVCKALLGGVRQACPFFLAIFLFLPTQALHTYSMVPADFRSGILSAVFAFLDWYATITCAPMICLCIYQGTIFVVLTTANLKFLENGIPEVAVSVKISLYQKFVRLTHHFNFIYAKYYTTALIAFLGGICIFNAFVLIRRFGTHLDFEYINSMFNGVMGGVMVVGFFILAGNLFVASSRLLWLFRHASALSNLERRRAKSLQPIGICVSDFFIVEESTTLEFIAVLLDATVECIVSIE